MPTLKKFRRYIAATAQNPAVLLPRKQYLFILSHMRARTSLLAHVLGSHPEISGHSEMHQGYSNCLDLLKLRCKVSIDNSNRLKGRYVLDKVVNNYALGRQIITAPNTKVIFLLRSPESTVKSIVSMGRRFGGDHWHTDPCQVHDYYVTRLLQLEGIAKMRAEAGAPPAFFFDSQMLLDHTTPLLRELTQWLGLATELSTHYEIFPTTGHAGWGDPSGAIRSAQIVKLCALRDPSERQVQILNTARATFDRVSATLGAVCCKPTLELR